MSVSSINIPLFSARHADTGEPVSNNEHAGGFTLNSGGPGTGTLTLQSELCVRGESISDTVMFETIVPEDYSQGADNMDVVVSVGMTQTPAVNASYPTKSVLSSATCSLAAFKCNNDGSATAIPVTDSPQPLPSVVEGFEQLSFGLDGSSINPGDRLMLFISTSFTEGAVSTNANIANVTTEYTIT